MQFTENFHQALQDYVFLLNKKYPEKSIHELISTRYSLSHFERSMLYRGITTNENAIKRKAKQLTIEQLNPGTLEPWNTNTPKHSNTGTLEHWNSGTLEHWNSGTLEHWNTGTLHIDLFNVLYTLAAYLRGFPVFISNDGLIRDASESHGTGEWEVHLDKGLDLLIDSLEVMKIQKAVIYIDNPLKYGLAISDKLREISGNVKPLIEIITDPSPDHLIREATDGIIATSDSTIIDKSPLPVFDLPRYILESCFHHAILNLGII
jgi:hypothetical protein